jgi:hypothetical protein
MRMIESITNSLRGGGMRTLVSRLSKQPSIIWLALVAVLLTGCVGAGNFVWHDVNGNGIQDSGEPGMPDVIVSLIEGNSDVVVSTTVTDAAGAYSLAQQGLAAGRYYLEFNSPGGYMFTLQDQGGNDDLDSDVIPLTGSTGIYDLSSVVDHVDAGLIIIPDLEEIAFSEEQTHEEATATPTPTPTPAPQEAAFEEVCYGPNPEDFPEGISPLTGLPVDDPSLLALRPVFLSISIFPPSVRPPTGLSVSPIVYELYIGDGDTRLMAGFYGDFPQPIFEGEGGEGVAAPDQFDYLVGDRVWFDANGNHLQDDGEPGVPDVPVSLLDSGFNVVQETTTDALGNYYFALVDIELNSSFQIRFGAPPTISDYYWVNKNMGDDAVDSDVTELGRTDFFDPTDQDPGEQLDIDAGVRQALRIEGLRSGRVAYQDLQVNYCGCLVTAGADPTVAEQINTCGSAFGSGDIGSAGLDVSRLQAIATNNSEGSCGEPNLTGNVFCTQPQIEGEPGNELFVEYNINNVDHFIYDPQVGAYLWEKNNPSAPDTFDLMTDRLTGENLTFENVIVLLTEHTSQNSAGTIIDLEMDHRSGTAYIFRNGMAYEAQWTTVATAYEQSSGHPLPVRFIDLAGNPLALAPGQTFITLLNAFDSVAMSGGGIWSADFDAPANP